MDNSFTNYTRDNNMYNKIHTIEYFHVVHTYKSDIICHAAVEMQRLKHFYYFIFLDKVY